ncbi:MAG: serine hydrolase [Bacteroidota bacterium]
MKTYLMWALIGCALTSSACAQDMGNYTGNWYGQFRDVHSFRLPVELKLDALSTFMIQLPATKLLTKAEMDKAGVITAQLSSGLSFTGQYLDEEQAVRGFIQSGVLQYHLHLKQNEQGLYTDTWQPLMVDSLAKTGLYLSVENGEGDQYEAYPFWEDNRFTGTWCSGFQKAGKDLTFIDFKTGLRFEGELQEEAIDLSIYLADALLTRIALKPYDQLFTIKNINSSLAPVPDDFPALKEMEGQIEAGTLENVHGVLVSKGGKTIYERYFGGYHPDIPHDQRSAAKSIASTITGIALDQSLFAGIDQSIYDFIPQSYQYTKEAQKAKIDLLSLLTMRSGLHADDYARGGSPASEGTYQSSPDWPKTVLEAPMMHAPNTHANYGSANPFLLGLALDSMVAAPLTLYMDRTLFAPLGITHYIVQNDNVGQPYFGGGMYLTPRQMAQYGQLYLQEGKWEGKQLLGPEWVKASFADYGPLENTPDQNHYGYLWWHHTYTAKGQTIQSREARGNGGQYIFVLPELDAVVAITSGNFRNGKTQQPEQILEEFVLPFLLEK